MSRFDDSLCVFTQRQIACCNYKLLRAELETLLCYQTFIMYGDQKAVIQKESMNTLSNRVKKYSLCFRTVDALLLFCFGNHWFLAKHISGTRESSQVDAEAVSTFHTTIFMVPHY